MEKIYYSGSKRGFFSDRDFGTVLKLIPDPDWTVPLIPDPDAEAPLIADPDWDGEWDALMISDPDWTVPLIPDPSAEAPLISVTNDDCNLPEDAVEITPDQHAAYLSPDAGQVLVHPSAEEPGALPYFEAMDVTVAYSSQAKAVRNAAVIAPLLLDGATFQVDYRSRDNMRNAMDYAERNGIPEETEQDWITSDNTILAVTADDLRAVLDAYTERMATIYSAYNSWRAGEMSEPFSVE